MTFENKVIWITGASSGIGRAVAIALSKEECKLILSARTKTALEATQRECFDASRIKILPLDLANYEAFNSLTRKALKLFGRIDILINNAGISQRSLIAETSIDVDAQLMHINYLGTVALTKSLLPYFIKQQSGYFVTITSLMGKFGSPYRSSYCGAKHALHGFFDVLRMEHENDHIKVTMVCPGFVNTKIALNALTGDGAHQNTQDQATENGLDPHIFAKRMIKAMKKEKFEAYIGQKEVVGVYLKRFFPKILHRVVMRSAVR